LLEEYKMAKKDIHIVFQVLNFLKSDHHLAQITTPAEHLLLINLASHKGDKGICPSVSTLVKELKLTKMTVIRSLQRWEELEVLQIQKNGGKKNYYFLYIPLSTSNIVNTGNIHATGNIGDTGLVTLLDLTGNIHDDIDIALEELSNNKELLYVDNSRRHDFADSMDRMASEEKHVRRHMERKMMECTPVDLRTPMPEDLRNLIKSLRK
jgi:DNA-binding MarR family transcriptional regulator